ncbi:Hypothetical predicted protein [Paramuricea clavata]|uniref:Uncharacterized protein n=1 Tax=Paramuricea clavata TaxID=317549 RepID=A0A7D9IE73_PARCT|nr:Hypothetical predicted protein [Paramuricea clavata]
MDNNLRSPTSVKDTEETKQAKVTSDIIKTSNETEDASLRKKISDICSTLVTSHQEQQVNDISKLPAIEDLCEILKQLSSGSTEHAVVEITDDFKKAIDKNLYTCGVVLDFSKAFDRAYS